MDSHERQWKRAVREDEALTVMIPFVVINTGPGDICLLVNSPHWNICAST